MNHGFDPSTAGGSKFMNYASKSSARTRPSSNTSAARASPAKPAGGDLSFAGPQTSR